MKVFAAILNLFVLFCFFNETYQLNMTAHRQMPPLYQFEDYDKCLGSKTLSTYCLVIAENIPNTSSALSNQIMNYSAYGKRHYRHDYLLLGICVDPCKRLVDSLSSSERDQLYNKGGITDTELVEYFTQINSGDAEKRESYDILVNTCLNYKFKKQYGLQMRSFIEYCETNAPASNFDFLEIAFMVFIGTLFFLAILSSNYDRQLKIKQPPTLQGTEFYRKPLYTPLDTLLTSFSIYRNYYRLSRPSSSQTASDFRFFEALRFFATMLVIVSHVFLLLKTIPALNTDFIEKFFYRFEANIFLNGTVVIQIFFVMSSFLLCFFFQKTYASKKPGLVDWGRIVMFRYLRMTPSLAFQVFLSASILPRLQDGPGWRFSVGAENVLCKQNWWSNLLYINNFMIKHSCLHQTWYLATDFQLYVLMSGVLIFIARFPKTRSYILGGGVVLSILITGLVTYFLGLDGTHQETPESYRYLFWTNSKTIYQGYFPFYMHFGGYFGGVIAALIYIKYKNEGLDLKGRKTNLNILFYLSFPFGFSLLFSGGIFYYYEFAKPSIWLAIYATLHRNLWALMCCWMVLMMCFKVGSLMYKFCSHKMFVPLGRLSFQVFLIHSVVIRCMGGCIRQPIYINIITFTTYTVACVSMSFILAFLLHMLVEMPLAVIINLFLKRSGKPTEASNTNQLGAKGKDQTIVPTTMA